MAEAIEVGSVVEVPVGPGRPRAIMMQVAKISGSKAWCARLGRKGKLEGPFELSDLKLDDQGGPIRLVVT